MARSFNGTSDLITPPTSVDFGSVANMANTGVGFSFSCWVKPTNFTAVRIVWSANSNGGLQVYYNSSTGNFTIDRRGQVNLLNVAGGLTTGVWNHILLAYNSVAATAVYYVNGNQSSNTSVSFSTVGAGHTYVLFGDTNSSQFMLGSTADFAFWPVTVLSASEAKALGKGWARPGAIRPLSLQIWYPLDGLQSPEPDLSGNKNNGTLTGTALASGPPFAPFTPRWPQFLTPPAAVLWAQSCM